MARGDRRAHSRMAGGTGVACCSALNLPAGTVYWTDAGEADVRWAGFDGSDPMSVEGRVRLWPAGIARITSLPGTFETGVISRANLDGTGVTHIISGLDSPRGLALDSEACDLYFTTAIPLPAGFFLLAPVLAALAAGGAARVPRGCREPARSHAG